jgi:hypothetical protein
VLRLASITAVRTEQAELSIAVISKQPRVAKQGGQDDNISGNDGKNQPGWYWYSNASDRNNPHEFEAIYVRDYVGELAVQNCVIKGSSYENGLWQGPITPND